MRCIIASKNMSKLRMTSLHKLGFLITQGWPALYPATEIEN